MAATPGAVVNGLGSTFLCGSSGRRIARSLFSIRNAGNATATRRFVVVAAVAKKSWIPAVRGGGNLIDPKWLGGS
ncbi:hypothetical protein MLD38_026735 [Melastoma candidum]|uniref:Uncharacterized protein n=1 Tax=Melastoma candidum TaxID=119954 RepID=A0ACB9P4G6_9MYRT|nr:hypothetical protein MLD38_026735 [Melastoma candidum]